MNALIANREPAWPLRVTWEDTDDGTTWGLRDARGDCLVESAGLHDACLLAATLNTVPALRRLSAALADGDHVALHAARDDLRNARIDALADSYRALVRCDLGPERALAVDAGDATLEPTVADRWKREAWVCVHPGGEYPDLEGDDAREAWARAAVRGFALPGDAELRDDLDS